MSTINQCKTVAFLELQIILLLLFSYIKVCPKSQCYALPWLAKSFRRSELRIFSASIDESSIWCELRISKQRRQSS